MVDINKNVRVDVTGKDSASKEINKATKSLNDLERAGTSAKKGIESISKQLENTKNQLLSFFVGLPILQACHSIDAESNRN